MTNILEFILSAGSGSALFYCILIHEAGESRGSSHSNWLPNGTWFSCDFGRVNRGLLPPSTLGKQKCVSSAPSSSAPLYIIKHGQVSLGPTWF